MLIILMSIWPCLLAAFVLGAALAYGVKSFLSQLALRSELPDVSRFAHKSQIPRMPDLSAYAKHADVPSVAGFVSRSELPDFAQFAQMSDIPETTGFLTTAALAPMALRTDIPDLTGYVRRSELPDLPRIPDLSGYAKVADVPKPPDLSPFALKSELSRFALRSDVPFVPDLSVYAHKTELPDMTPFARLTDIPAPPDLAGYATLDEAREWRAAVEERDRTIAGLHRQLADEAALRAREIARLEALLAGWKPPAVEAAPPVRLPLLATAPPAELPALAKPDDLKLIWGVGPVLERRLHAAGVTTFREIALWTDADIDAIEPKLDTIPDRIRREDWVSQCQALHLDKHGETIEIAPRVKEAAAGE
jgi:predicted flap endonuclease-1-like 5' DNA nuclease